jgi:hypothetical protein
MGRDAYAMKQSFGVERDPFGSIDDSFAHCESATHMPHNRNRYRRIASCRAMLCSPTYSNIEFPIARVPDGRGARCAGAKLCHSPLGVTRRASLRRGGVSPSATC